MKQVSFYLLSLFCLGTMSAQVRNYDVLLGSKKVGSVVATKTISDGEIAYETDFKIKLRIIKLYDIESVTRTVFKEDIMQSSNMKVYDGGELDEEKTIEKDDKTYRCIDCEDEPIVVAEDLIYTNVAKIYFEEPKVHQQVYTERYLNFGTMTALGDHKYKYKMPNGDVNVYIYKDGKMESILVDRMLYNLTFKYIE